MFAKIVLECSIREIGLITERAELAKKELKLK
jgi:hypothetical protein